MLLLASTRRLLHGATVASHHHPGRNRNKVFTRRFVGNMKERHDDAFKKVNGAQERRRGRTGQRHGKAFASVFTLLRQAPHVDDHGIDRDVSQAIIPRRDQTRQRIHIHTSRAGGSPPASNPAGARLDSAQPPSSPKPSRVVQRRYTQPPPTPRPLPVSSFPAAQLLPRLHMLPLASTRRLLHGATIASHHHHGRQPPWSAGRLHATVTSRHCQLPPSPVAASSRRPSRSGRGGVGPGDGARHSAPGWSETTMTARQRSLLWWPGRAAVRRRRRLQSPWFAAVVATVTVSPRRRPPPFRSGRKRRGSGRHHRRPGQLRQPPSVGRARRDPAAAVLAAARLCRHPLGRRRGG